MPGRAARVACALAVASALVLHAHAGFLRPSVHQGVEDGGGGVLPQCPGDVIKPRDISECEACVSEERECPDGCCAGNFRGAPNQEIFCHIGGCCQRGMQDRNGSKMYVFEKLTATERKNADNRTCKGYAAKEECLECAIAFSGDVPRDCAAEGFDVPARNAKYTGTGSCAGGGGGGGGGKSAEGGGGVADGKAGSEGVPEATDGGVPQATDDGASSGSSEPARSAGEGAKGSESGSKTDQTANNKSDGGRSNAGAIAGGSVGGAIAVLALCGLCLCCCRRRQRKANEEIPFPAMAAKHVSASRMPPRMPRIESTPSVVVAGGPEAQQPAAAPGPPASAPDRELELAHGAATAGGAPSATPPTPALQPTPSKVRRSPLERPLPRTPPDSPPRSEDGDVSTPHPAYGLGRASLAGDERFGDDDMRF